jgi:hypothetical protein
MVGSTTSSRKTDTNIWTYKWTYWYIDHILFSSLSYFYKTNQEINDAIISLVCEFE